MNAAPLSTRHRYAAEWLAGALTLAISAGLIVFHLEQGHESIDLTERDRLAVHARVIEDNLGQQFDGIGKALASVQVEHARPVAPAPADESRRMKVLSDAMPSVRNLFLLDASGTVTASSEPTLLGRNFRERDYFAIPNRTRDPAMLHVSPPFTTVLGNFVIVVGRVLLGQGGEFRGVVVASLDNAYFEGVMRSLLYAPDMQVALVHADGKTFLSLPPQTQAGPPEDRGPRIVAARQVAPAALRMDKPLVVSLSRSEPAVYRAWRNQAAELGAFFGLLAVGMPLGLYRSQRSRREFDRLEASAADERRVGAERLELALRGAQLGLWDWDLAHDRFNRNELTRLQLGYSADDIGVEGAAWRALFHPDDRARVLATIDDHLRGRTDAYEVEVRLRHQDGHWVWLLSRGKVVERDAEGRPLRMAGTHMDITERKRLELELTQLNQRLTLLSTTDGLTEVGNRRLFDQTLSAEWARAARKGETIGLLMIDVDRFKDYNDRYGHPAGDACLRTIARLISETVQREGELVARYGGEEFALLLPGADLAAARIVAERCLRALADADIEQAGEAGRVTMSIGVASATASPEGRPSDLVDAADSALYRAKRAGRGRLEC